MKLTSAISSSPRSSFGLVKPCWAVKFVNLCPSSLVTRYVSGRSASESSNFFTYWNLLLAMLTTRTQHRYNVQRDNAASAHERISVKTQVVMPLAITPTGNP